MKFAWDVAKYDNPKEFDHDVNAINRAEKKVVLKNSPDKTFMKT